MQPWRGRTRSPPRSRLNGSKGGRPQYVSENCLPNVEPASEHFCKLNRAQAREHNVGEKEILRLLSCESDRKREKLSRDGVVSVKLHAMGSVRCPVSVFRNVLDQFDTGLVLRRWRFRE